MKNSLLIIRFSALGDVAMMVPVILALRKEYPELAITVLTRSQFAPIFTRIQGISVIGVDLKGEYSGFKGLIRLARLIKSKKYGAVADFHNVLRTNILKILLQFSGIPFHKLDKGRAEKKQLTRAEDKVFKPLKPTVERYASVLEKLGYPLKSEVYPHLTPADSGTLPVNWRVSSGIKKVGLAPFAAHPGKQYPLKKMEEVITMLYEEDNVVLFFLGSPAESALLENWARKYPGTINAAGKNSFETELNLISQLDVLIGMDSGNGHLAAMFGVPVLTIWGVTHPYAGFAPYGQAEENWLLSDRDQYPAIPTSIYGNTCPEGYEQAIATITPRQIVKKTNSILRS